MLYKFLSICLAQQKLIYILQHSRGFLAYHQVSSYVLWAKRLGIIFLDLISFISVCNFPWSRQNLTMNKENRKFASPCLNNLPTKSIFYCQPRGESGGKIWLFIIVPVSASLRWNSCNNATKNEPNELCVPRTINWLMNEVKQINQDQAESTRRSNWTLSFFPSMLPDQLCFPWVTYSGELSWKFTQNLGHFYRRFHSNFASFPTKLLRRFPSEIGR